MATSTSESKTKEIYTEIHDREQFLSFFKTKSWYHGI